MGRLFWIVIMLLVAIAAHIGYVLFAPSIMFDRNLNALTPDIQQNQFFVLPQGAQRQLFPAYPAYHVFGLCKYDLRNGGISLTANMPPGYWTLSVYSRTGKQFYSLNEQQSGTNQFTVQLSRSKSIFELLMGAGDEAQNPVENLGWTVESRETSGLAVFWVPIADPLMRNEVVSTISSSQCAAKPAV